MPFLNEPQNVLQTNYVSNSDMYKTHGWSEFPQVMFRGIKISMHITVWFLLNYEEMWNHGSNP